MAGAGVTSAASSAGTKKAAATVAAGGGPEDPVADAAAGAQLMRSQKASKKSESYGTTKNKQSSQNFVTRLGPKSKTDTRRLLLTEFIVCITVLGFGTLVPTPKGRKDEGMGHLLVKSTAFSLLFFVLALISSSGKKAGKLASGVGGLVTLAYVLTSEDAYNILSWITSFYGKPGTPGAGVSTTVYSGGYAGESVAQQNAVNSAVNAVNTIAETYGTVYAANSVVDAISSGLGDTSASQENW